MNVALFLLTLCQGLFLSNKVLFVAINGLVGLGLAPEPWMATLPVAGGGRRAGGPNLANATRDALPQPFRSPARPLSRAA